MVRVESISLTNHSIKEDKYCPFRLLRDYAGARATYLEDDEPFFVHTDWSLVKTAVFRNVLKQSLEAENLNSNLYDCHSFRIGRASDLLKLNLSLESIKSLGRWKSNSVYAYLKV